MYNKAAKAPQDLIRMGMLKRNGYSAIGACSYSAAASGRMYLQDHVLLVVLEGTYKIRLGGREYPVRKHEMMLLQKAILIEYDKYGNSESGDLLDYMMFFIKDDLIQDFFKLSKYTFPVSEAPVPLAISPIDERMLYYAASLKPYFQEQEKKEDELMRLKLLELMFNMGEANQALLYQFLQLKPRKWSSIVEMMENNYTNPVTLADLAYLSGRSLSTFKREFRQIYREPTFQWLRNRRLEKAKELLTDSGVSVTEACFASGFENVTHFSAVFKKKYGLTPSAMRAARGQ